jgi:hypothetical protein
MGRLISMAIDQFTYVPEENCYICPEGKPLKYVGINPRNRTHLYYSTVKRCRECSQKSRCTRGKYRTLAFHTCESARQRVHAHGRDTRICHLATGTSEGRSTLRRAEESHRTTPTKAAQDALREQFYLAATAQNLKRLVRFLSSTPTPQIAPA